MNNSSQRPHNYHITCCNNLSTGIYIANNY